MCSIPYRSPRCISCWLAVLFVFGTARASAASLFPTNAAWKYLKGQSEASLPEVAAWRLAGFDDAPWVTGPAPFYYGEPLTGTVAQRHGEQLHLCFSPAEIHRH